MILYNICKLSLAKNTLYVINMWTCIPIMRLIDFLFAEIYFEFSIHNKVNFKNLIILKFY